MENIMEFQGQYRFLSNFISSSFVWDGIMWPHVEAAYQAAKTMDRSKRIQFSQMNNPTVAKRAGGKRSGFIVLRSDWEEVKYGVMLDIVREKFKQNPELKAKLIATGMVHLEEGNNHGDNVWGCCPPRSGRGLNYLGKVLMELRDEFILESAA